jgi:hypothetical protein
MQNGVQRVLGKIKSLAYHGCQADNSDGALDKTDFVTD